MNSSAQARVSSEFDRDPSVVRPSEVERDDQNSPRAKTVLCVDDSPTELRLMLRALSDQGYAILTATDGEEVLRQVAAHDPDLILLDIILPKKNGFQVCRQVKTAPSTKHIRIILVSSKSQDTDRFWGLKQGADDYVTKPFRSQDVRERVSRQLVGEVAGLSEDDRASRMGDAGSERALRLAVGEGDR